MSLNSSDWIELCNCFDFWPRAFIFPLFPWLFHSHFLKPHTPQHYDFSYLSPVWQKCNKQFEMLYCSAATQFIWPGLWGAPSTPSYSSGSWPKAIPIMAPTTLACFCCASVSLLSTHKLMMLTMTVPKSPAPWLARKSRKLKFLPPNRNSAWPTEMETSWMFPKPTIAEIVQDICVLWEVFQKSCNESAL